MKTKTKSNITIWYVVVVVALLNVVAFLSEKSWSSIGILLLASGVTYAVKPDRTLALVAGIVVANLYKATAGVHEGMAIKNRKKPAKKPDATLKKNASKPKENAVPEALTSMLGGSEKSLEGLMDRQNQLMANLKNMQPIMAQAQQMMSHLPKGFMDKALKQLTTQNNLTP